MKLKSICFLLFLFLVTFSARSSAAEYQPLDPRKAYTSSEILKNVTDAYWQRTLSDDLYLQIKYGLEIKDLPDISYEKGRADLNFASSLFAQLKRVKKAELSHEELLSDLILEWELLNTMQGFQYFWLNIPVTPYASPLPTIKLAFSSYQLKEEKDLDGYLKLLAKYPDFIHGTRKRLEDQAGMKIVLPVEEVDQVVPFLSSYANEDPTQSDFYVDANRLKSFPESRAKEFQKSVATVIQTNINPSVKDLVDYVDHTYRKAAPQSVGMGQYPNGKDYYRLLVKYHTTVDATPEEIHQVGLTEVARINERMQQVRNSIGFKGSKEEFHKFLATDPKFFPKTPDEIGQKLMVFVQNILPKIDSFFLKLPKAPYGVKRLDPGLEGSMTFGYYQEPTKADPKGYYNYNGSDLKDRSLLDAGALIYHELIPGHHFQLNLQSENDSLPSFRRESAQTAYVEGWAEYASDLAEQMGMYSDPYDLYGRLTADMFLTVRLVVDTGMNYMGWSREKAMQYMKENTLLSETQIRSESLRYSTDIPGQALAYKMGSKKIQELRKECQDNLKEKFDYPKFHDAVLGSGSMPMTVLEKHIEWFIESQNQQ